jgi:hypothetical protein
MIQAPELTIPRRENTSLVVVIFDAEGLAGKFLGECHLSLA